MKITGSLSTASAASLLSLLLHSTSTDAAPSPPWMSLDSRDVPGPEPQILQRRADTDYTPNITLLNTITDTIASSQRASWEQGTAASAFLELWNAQWSVFAGSNQGPPYRPNHIDINRASHPNKVLSMGLRSIASQDGIGRLSSRVTGDETTSSGSALDSASNGESVLIGAWLNGDINPFDFSINAGGSWISAATRQLAFVLNTVPRSRTGAISHRFPDVQLWSDGVYMGPPFYASYGLMTNNQTLLQLAYDQCRLYRDALRITEGTSTGMWAHIWVQSTQNTTTTGNTTTTTTAAPASGFYWVDSNSWVTGNGWATAGMLRVAASIAQSSFASSMSSQISDLTSWTREILDAAFPLADSSTGLFHNYANVSTQFLDSAGSALLAYSAFRLASMGGLDDAEVNSLITPAERIYQSVQAGVGPLGDLTPGLDVVNVLSFNSDSTHSSTESLSFLMLLSAARRDFAAGNVTGLTGAGSSNAGKHGKLSALGGPGEVSKSTATGAIVGGVLGGLVAGFLLGLLAMLCLRRRRERRERTNASMYSVRNNGRSCAATQASVDSPNSATGSAFGNGSTSSQEEKGDEGYSVWKILSPSNSLRRGVSFKEGTKASRNLSHRRKNPSSGSIGSGFLSRNSTLKRGGSERRRAALQAQDEAVFDDDEMTVGHGHGRSNSEALVENAVPMTTLATTGLGAAGVGAAAAAHHHAEEPASAPMSRAPSSRSSSDKRRVARAVIPVHETVQTPSPGLPIPTTVTTAPKTYADPVHVGPGRIPRDYFATPGAADPNRAPSDAGSGRAAAAATGAPVAAAGAVYGLPPERPTRHSRKPSSRAKALRSNRDQILDGTTYTERSRRASEDDAARPSSAGNRGNGMQRSGSSGSVLSESERAMRAEEGAALKGRGRSHRHARSLSNASNQGGLSVDVNDEVPVPALPGSRHSPAVSRTEDVRSLRAFLAHMDQEGRARTTTQQDGAVAQPGAPIVRPSRSPNRMPSSSGDEFPGSSRSRSVEGHDRSRSGSAAATPLGRTGSGSSPQGVSGGLNAGRSIRRVPAPQHQQDSAATGGGGGGGGGGFASVGDVLAAGVQYPNGARTTSTRRTRVPSGGAAGGR
ncbi:hypothetical protein OC846_005061 [Tilletia horrida]|uniref:Glycoside hydrolase family 76 protein n=1 Tax=Tilletia horrida TaxID=155126 RepID=A0AAN6GMI6_9BASI|nr:hypothetical protein OC846_005061 [Tilletia horrida]KAK0562536.1 hypothetical protein OC861_005263 [Tilletia horrida]